MDDMGVEFVEEAPRLTRKQIQRIRDVEAIQNAAFVVDGPNRVSRTINFQQGLSILLRSQQLAHDTMEINPADKARQIEYCWRNKRR